ncbi:MAG: FKBP-type peptidyl-prolyl cis-trans isomerase [Solirubrobacteraceae bacterium]
MRRVTTSTLAMLGLAAALEGCGGSTAPGVQAAPSGGATAAAAVPATSSSTTTSSASTSTTPLPAALRTKPNVVSPSGPPPTKLVVKDLIKGTGPVASPGATVTVQYVGVLYKGGKQFDASWNDPGGKPVSLPLSGVIKGWQEGIPGMRVGGRRELIIPSGLGYGAKGSPPKIPPNSALVFVIDLHGVS